MKNKNCPFLSSNTTQKHFLDQKLILWNSGVTYTSTTSQCFSIKAETIFLQRINLGKSSSYT